MKVIVVCGAGYVSGKERMALFLLKNLKSQHVEVSCITSIWGDGAFNKMLKQEDIDYEQMPIGFISKVFSLKPLIMTLHQLLYLPILWFKYNRLIKKNTNAIIIHTNLHHSILLLPFIQKKRTNFYYLHESVINSSFYNRLFSIFEKRFTKFIVVSNFVANTLVQCKVDVENVVIIHNSIQVDERGQTIPKGGKKIRIGIVGQIAPWKGHEDLLEAVSILFKKGVKEEIECVIIGKGDAVFTEHLVALSQKLNISNVVKFEGFKSSLHSIYGSLDIVCVPSRFAEPFGLSALEPANYCIPVIATCTGGLPEIIINRETGILITPKQPQILADELILLIGDKDLRGRLGNNAFIRLNEEFSKEGFIEKWMKLLTYEVNPLIKQS